ncbi:DUF6542 domain-containing protein [Nocardioides sp. Bht2]|uniref:DUF6542 domain-containing protein n=1 Tax=Nocardioides sp. Bht2 TaxID=3392297 RepID=UPI0039B3DD59
MTRARTIWEEGTEPGRQVVLLGSALTLVATVANLVISQEITWIFDIAFVVVSILVSLRVRPSDFLTIAMFPPILMIVTFFILAIVGPGTIAHSGDGVVQAWVSGLTHHAGALAIGFALCLTSLGIRQRFLTLHRPLHHPENGR